MDIVYLVRPELKQDLLIELNGASKVEENLLWAGLKQDVCFASDILLNPQIEHFSSISQAQRILRNAAKYWFLYPLNNIRRSKLIEQGLLKLPSLIQTFPIAKPLADIGFFTLLDQNTILYASKRLKNPPLGIYQFVEDKINPPNRAYLKLWEALSILQKHPKKNDTVIDLGASPGGWTYVMQSLGAKVTAIDKAKLDNRISSLPNVFFKEISAFAFEPEKLEKPIDWLLCDVACYPDRLYNLVNRWIASNKAKQMIITVKLQGQTEHNIIEKFKSIPNSRLMHLSYNKHELTFFHPWF
jgi:23S rRNA (cytidine2498-2'-O)-methyltransferase